MSSDQETIVMSLGGSMIVPGAINISFLKDFKLLVKKQIEKGKRVIIITGGGATARDYIAGLEVLRPDADSENLDWMGIYGTHINAHLVRLALGDLAPVGTFSDPSIPLETDAQLVVAGGWKPGWSSDYPAVLIAGQAQDAKVINLSNIAHVYSEDPRKNPDAVKYDNLSWSEYLDLIPEEWTPGLSSPFDPIASRKAQELGVEVAIMNGSDLDNLESYLDGRAFEGTVIK
jgi:uridylate kinase